MRNTLLATTAATLVGGLIMADAAHASGYGTQQEGAQQHQLDAEDRREMKAQGDSSTTYGSAEPDATQAQGTMQGDSAAKLSAQQVTLVSLNGFSGNDLRGACVTNADAEEIGEVHDIVIDGETMGASLIVKGGGPFNWIGEEKIISFNAVEIDRGGDDNELTVRVASTDKDLDIVGATYGGDDNLDAWETTINDLVGNEIPMEIEGQNISINDLVIMADGTVSFLVLGIDQGLLGMDEREVAIDASLLNHTGQRFMLGANKSDLESAPAYMDDDAS